MTLTVCVGSSGSGKTTFLNDVHKSHKCTYIRQYHTVRPYIPVCKIPNFDPTKLPYWQLYVGEGTAPTLQVGGTMNGENTAGLSGGQRKLFLFELICQRTKNHSDLLIVLDEPFSGVTDDFVPYIAERLGELQAKHNVLLVTNDHIQVLTEMADNTIKVSALDRSTIQVNGREKVNREKAIQALSVGDEYVYKSSDESAIKFFFDVEVLSNSALRAIACFSVFSYALLLATFWDSAEESAALALSAAGYVLWLCINPYIISLVDWRNCMLQESEALMHSSKGTNRALKATMSLSLILIVAFLEYGMICAVLPGLSDFKFWVAIFFDNAFTIFPLIALALYTRMPFSTVFLLGSLPALFTIFFSTAFSPGGGIPVLKELRYLFPRFYFWCMTPGVNEQMEGCPSSEMVNVLSLVVTSVIPLFLFLFWNFIMKLKKDAKTIEASRQKSCQIDKEFYELQSDLYTKCSDSQGDDGFKTAEETEHSASSGGSC
jgi:hypothetical protein